MNDIVWLSWVGGRRPDSLNDQGRYHEQISRPAAQPVAHDNPAWVYGESLGRNAT